MFVRVIEGLIRLVVMHGAVVLMVVVVDVPIVLQHVDERDRLRDWRQAALHGKTIQGQAQQEEVDNPTQGNHQASFAKLYQPVCSHRFPSNMLRVARRALKNCRTTF